MIDPELNELPSSFADRLGVQYAATVTAEHKKSYGQFFTPKEVAHFIASQISVDKPKIKILDPGCGIGILSCALIEKLVTKPSQVKEIELTAFETDIALIPAAEKCFAYMRTWLASKNVNLTHVLAKNDFILANSKILNNLTEVSENLHDIVVTNPPYFKIRKDDSRAVESRSIIHGQTNIYSIFLMLSARLLRENGKIVFITPRSFASGSYFKLFREKFFAEISLDFIHLFESRKEAFQRDKVLQESIIVSGTKQAINYRQQLLPFLESEEPKVTISLSSGITDLELSTKTEYRVNEIIDLDSKDFILHIPASVDEEAIMKVFKSWQTTLSQLGYDVSTGPVVAFRSKEEIAFENAPQALPLFWLHNILKMKLAWPIHKAKKGQYIKLTKASLPKVLPSKNYVLVRRFSSKDDSRRLIACPYFANDFPNVNNIGVENHLNYIYKYLGDLEEIEAIGIAGLLNSTLFDAYFRTFNGNTNVGATELKNLPFPNADILKSFGRIIKRKGYQRVSQKTIDKDLRALLNLQ